MKRLSIMLSMMTILVLASPPGGAAESTARNGDRALSELCRKLMYKQCNPERDEQLERFFGNADISAMERSLREQYDGTAPAFRDLPKDRSGLVDWGAAVSAGLIRPRDSITGTEERAYEPYDGNLIVMKTRIDVIPDVIFPHGVHTYWLSCESCHPSPFKKAKGETSFSMREIIDGKFCGKCHGKVAFPPQSFKSCGRCHALRKTDDIPPWGDL